MKTKFLLFSFALVPLLCLGSPYEVKRMDWNGVEVIWVQDEQRPLFSISVYFADGALSDDQNRAGETTLAFSQLTSGTPRYSHEQVSEILEFFGSGTSANVTHEFSSFSWYGLSKDIVPITKMVCQLFQEASFPNSELQKKKTQILTGLKNMVIDHGSLASRAMRKVSMRGTPYAQEASGGIQSIQKIQPAHLLSKKDYLNEKVKKKIFISGPASVLKVESTIVKDCGWNSGASYVRSVEKPVKSLPPGKIYFLPIPKANQTQIQLGNLIVQGDLKDSDEILEITSTLLGGSFSSLLMQELRVRRGLTYSVGAYAGGQAQYGRTLISTFTKNQTVEETLGVIESILKSFSTNTWDQKNLEMSKKYLKGSFPFRFESTISFLGQLMLDEHRGKSLESLYEFPARIEGITPAQVAGKISSIFSWKNLNIVAVGDAEILPQLKKRGEVQILKIEDIIN